MQSHALYILIILIFTFFQSTNSQESKDSTGKVDIFPLPVIGYSEDRGIKYGGMLGLYHYSKDQPKSEYRNKLEIEASRSTKGNHYYSLEHQYRNLPKGFKLFNYIIYDKNNTARFFGFNSQTPIMQGQDFDRAYFSFNRQTFKVSNKFHLLIIPRHHIYLTGGLIYYNANISPTNLEKLPATYSNDTTTLFDEYIKHLIIPKDEVNGGQSLYAQAGLLIDNRERPVNPQRGYFSEIIFIAGQTDHTINKNFIKASFTHQHYLPLIKNRLTGAIRMSYQPLLDGKLPYYMLPVFYSSIQNIEELGGENTLRGMNQNRILSDGFLLSNLELRLSLWDHTLFNYAYQTFLVLFSDIGLITQEYNYPQHLLPPTIKQNISSNQSPYYQTIGAGAYVVIRENMVAKADIGKEIDAPYPNWYISTGMRFLF